MKSPSLIFSFLIAIFFSLVVILFDSFSWLGWLRGSVETIFRPEARILSFAAGNINRSVATVRYVSSGPSRITDLERRLAAAEREAISTARSREISEGHILGRPAQVLSSGPQLIIEIPPDLSDTPDFSGKPVVSPDGVLLGSVAAVGRWSARVKLLSDSASQIPVAVLTPNKQKLAKGVLTGAFGASLTLEKVLTEVELQPDLAVVTTGEDDLFPPDLLVGWIGKTGPKQTSSLYQTAQIVPAAEISGLKIVFIIL